MNKRYFILLFILTLFVIPNLYIVTTITSPIAHDPGIYLTIARGVTVGKIPYLDFFTNKTPGFFFVFATVFQFIGDNIYLAKAVNILVVLGGGFLSYLITLRLIGKRSVAVMAPLVLLSGSLVYGGYKIQLEQWVTLFVMLAMYCFFNHSYVKISRKKYFWAGLLIGVSAMFKQYGIIFLGIFLLWALLHEKPLQTLGPFIRRITLLIAGSLIPAVIVLITFFLWSGSDGLGYLIDQTLLVNLRNYSSSDLNSIINANIRNFESFFPAWLALGFIPLLFTDYLTDPERNKQKMALFLSGFILLSLFPMYKRQYPHYYLLTLPALSLIIPYITYSFLNSLNNNGLNTDSTVGSIIQTTLYYFLLLLTPALVVLGSLRAYKIIDSSYLDRQLKTAKIISERTENDKIIVLGHRAIYYYLAEKWPPSRNLYYAALNTDYYDLDSMKQDLEEVDLAITPLVGSCLPGVIRQKQDVIDILWVIHSIHRSWDLKNRIQLIGPQFIHIYQKGDSNSFPSPSSTVKRNHLTRCLTEEER